MSGYAIINDNSNFSDDYILKDVQSAQRRLLLINGTTLANKKIYNIDEFIAKITRIHAVTNDIYNIFKNKLELVIAMNSVNDQETNLIAKSKYSAEILEKHINNLQLITSNLLLLPKIFADIWTKTNISLNTDKEVIQNIGVANVILATCDSYLYLLSLNDQGIFNNVRGLGEILENIKSIQKFLILFNLKAVVNINSHSNEKITKILNAVILPKTPEILIERLNSQYKYALETHKYIQKLLEIYNTLKSNIQPFFENIVLMSDNIEDDNNLKTIVLETYQAIGGRIIEAESNIKDCELLMTASSQVIKENSHQSDYVINLAYKTSTMSIKIGNMALITSRMDKEFRAIQTKYEIIQQSKEQLSLLNNFIAQSSNSKLKILQ